MSGLREPTQKRKLCRSTGGYCARNDSREKWTAFFDAAGVELDCDDGAGLWITHGPRAKIHVEAVEVSPSQPTPVAPQINVSNVTFLHS